MSEMERSAYCTVAVSRQLWDEGPRAAWRRELRRLRDEALPEFGVEVSGPLVVSATIQPSVLEFTWYYGPRRLVLLQASRLEQIPLRRAR